MLKALPPKRSDLSGLLPKTGQFHVESVNVNNMEEGNGDDGDATVVYFLRPYLLYVCYINLILHCISVL